MEDKRLDDLFRKSLEDYSVDYDPETWDSLSNRLDVDDSVDGQSDKDFDEEVRSTLETFEEPYNSSSWPILLNKIQASEAYELRVVITKSLEGILFILLLLTGFRFVPELAPPLPTDSYAFKEMTDGEATYQSLARDAYRLTTVQNISTLKVLSIDESELLSLDQNISKINVHQNGEFGEVERLQAKNMSLIPVSYEPIKLEHVNDLRESEMLPVLETTTEKLDNRIWLAGIDKVVKKEWSIGVYMAADFNHIMTPYDNIYQRNGYEQFRVGMGGGISLLFGSDKIKFETGIGYSSKKYAPKKVVEIFTGARNNEYLAVSLDDIKLNMVSIPLNVQYKFDNVGKWHFYGVGGLSLNLVAQADYQKTQDAIYAFTVPELEDHHEFNASRSANLDKKKFSKGLLEGGSFSDNSFVSFNLGAGVERLFNDKWSLYLQPTYHSNFLNTGLGPNQDKIHLYSMKVGVRHTFGN